MNTCSNFEVTHGIATADEVNEELEDEWCEDSAQNFDCMGEMGQYFEGLESCMFVAYVDDCTGDRLFCWAHTTLNGEYIDAQCDDIFDMLEG